MALVSLSISAAKLRGNATVDHSVLGLNDALGYSVTAAGTGLTDFSAAVTFTSYAGELIASGTCAMTAAADGLSASGSGELSYLDRWKLKTAHNAGGNSTLGISSGAVSATCSIQVVLASAWGIKQRYFPGKPDQVIDEGLTPPVTFDIMPDSTVWAAIEAAVSKFEALSKVLLRKRTFATRALKQSGDAEIGATDLNYQTGKVYMSTSLPHCYVRDTPDIQIYYGKLLVFPPPAEWRDYTVDRRLGLVRHVPVTLLEGGSWSYQLSIQASAPFFPVGSMGGSIASNLYQSPQQPPFAEGRRQRVPDAIQYRYQAGWNEEEQSIPAHWLQWIEREAAIAIASDWERALTESLASTSLSKDGLSRSISNSDPQMVKWTETMTRLQDELWKRISVEFPVRPMVIE